MKTGGQSPEAAPGEGSAPRLVLSGPARGADRARHSLGFSHGNGSFPWKNGRSLTAPAAAAPSRREHPPPGPCGTEGPGLSKGETRRPFLPHRCGGETPPWPRRGRRRFRQWQRVLRGSASAGRAGPGRAGRGSEGREMAPACRHLADRGCGAAATPRGSCGPAELREHLSCQGRPPSAPLMPRPPSQRLGLAPGTAQGARPLLSRARLWPCGSLRPVPRRCGRRAEKKNPMRVKIKLNVAAKVAAYPSVYVSLS